jgi:SAM-dependent methyltransferase
MADSNATNPGSDYGLDAPGVVRNLFICGSICLLVWITTAAGLWSGALYGVYFAPAGLSIGIALTFTGLWMVWSSKIGKVRTREQLLNHIAWTGAEQILDIGCGRGLMLIGAAKRLTTGKAIGIDIWQTEDLSGNKPEATLENARREGVANRVEVKTADMRQIPLPDGAIDVVVSCAAIHNLYNANDRAQAIREIVRVLRPGGQALIDDIRHARQYAATFAATGCQDIQRIESPLLSWFVTLLTCGSLRPGTLLVRKPGGPATTR